VIPLAFPEYPFEVRTDERGRRQVLDSVRRRFVRLTPEEWVRQHLLRYLAERGYPLGLTSVEKKLEAAGYAWRADIVVSDRRGQPLLVAECKAPGIAIKQSAFDQAARYNLSAGARCLVITNGLTHYCCVRDPDETHWRFVDDVPVYGQLVG
jgi:predicted type IV restriction endonuclease